MSVSLHLLLFAAVRHTKRKKTENVFKLNKIETAHHALEGRQAMHTKPIICVDLNYHWELKIENITPHAIRSPALQTPSTEHIHNITTMCFILYCPIQPIRFILKFTNAQWAFRCEAITTFKSFSFIQVRRRKKIVHFFRSKWQIERKTGKKDNQQKKNIIGFESVSNVNKNKIKGKQNNFVMIYSVRFISTRIAF